MRLGYRERFARHRLQKKPLVSDLGMHHVRNARAVMHVGIANPRWRGKRSRHSRRMRNPQFYVSGKMPILDAHLLFAHQVRDNMRSNCYCVWASLARVQITGKLVMLAAGSQAMCSRSHTWGLDGLCNVIAKISDCHLKINSKIHHVHVLSGTTKCIVTGIICKHN